jgi:hypothetical protein
LFSNRKQGNKYVQNSLQMHPPNVLAIAQMFGLLDNVFLEHLTKVVTCFWDVGMIIVGVGGWKII